MHLLYFVGKRAYNCWLGRNGLGHAVDVKRHKQQLVAVTGDIALTQTPQALMEKDG